MVRVLLQHVVQRAALRLALLSLVLLHAPLQASVTPEEDIPCAAAPRSHATPSGAIEVKRSSGNSVLRIASAELLHVDVILEERVSLPPDSRAASVASSQPPDTLVARRTLLLL